MRIATWEVLIVICTLLISVNVLDVSPRTRVAVFVIATAGALGRMVATQWYGWGTGIVFGAIFATFCSLSGGIIESDHLTLAAETIGLLLGGVVRGIVARPRRRLQ